MRFTILHLRDSPFVGGPEKQILGQCKYIDHERFEPIVTTFTSDASAGNELVQAAGEIGIQTAQLSDGKLNFPIAVRQLCSIIRNMNVSLIISHGFKADFTAFYVNLLTRIPFIAYFHGNTASTARVRFYEALDRIIIHRAKKVISVCEASAAELKRMGIHRIAVVPNAVDTADIAADGSREVARTELGIKKNETVIGTVGRLSMEKGHIYFIEAAGEILLEYPSVRFVIVGDGPRRVMLEKYAVELGVFDKFIFTGFRNDAVALMKGFDIFVLPSLRENMPVSLLEAMASGICVVATDVGGVRDVLSPANVDPVVPRSPGAIAGAVIPLLTDESLCFKQSQALLECSKRFSFKNQRVIIERLLQEQINV